MKLGTGILDLLFPPKCPFCQRILDHTRAPVCPVCQEELPWLLGEAAVRPLAFTNGCVSPLRYRNRVKNAIVHYKFTPNPASGEPLGILMAQCVRDHGEIQPDGITWAPLHWMRKQKRGFDQAERLARVMGRELGLPVVSALCKRRNTPAQSGLQEEAQRRANAMGAYQLRKNLELPGKRFLLVDDVVTSGSTLEECAGLLRMAGAEQIWCVTAAQAGSPKSKQTETEK